MSHDAHHPEPPPRKACNGPGNCYGMPEKRFWRIVFASAFLSMAAIVTSVVLIEIR
jgi:hypothetical protein